MSTDHDHEPVPVIDRPDQLSAEWLTLALRSAGHPTTVAEVTTSPIGTGQMCTSIRCEMTFEGSSGGAPDTLVAKLPTADENKRELVAGIHRTEVAFYRELAPTLSIRTPTCHHAGISASGAEFVVLLEDLAPREQGDQILGCTPEQARGGVVNLAGLHGPRWCDDTLDALDWLSAMTGDDAEMIGVITRSATETFVETHRDRLSDEDRTLLREIPEALPEWILGRSTRFAPLHGDYRLDNLLFGEDPDDVATVDWQTVTLGLPARDLSYFLSTSLLADTRRQHEPALVAAYRDALAELGVTDYTQAQCEDDYAFAMLQGPLITTVGAAYGERTDRGDEMFLAMAARSCEAIRDHRTMHLI